MIRGCTITYRQVFNLNNRLINSNNFIQSFQNGEEEGFSYFFKALYPVLCVFAQRYVSTMAAEDVVTESFLKVWEKREGFEHAVALKSYLYKSVYHGCLKLLEKEKRMGTVEVKDEVEEKAAEENYLVNIIRTETIRELYAAMDRLPKECRKVFDLLYVQGKSMKEAAEELAVSISTVKAQKARGLKLLRLRIHSISILFMQACYFLFLLP